MKNPLVKGFVGKIWRSRDINHTKNFNLKRILDVKEINQIKSKFSSNTYDINSLVFFKMVSKRIDLIKLEKEFIEKEENKQLCLELK